jgi:hypothetical protein
MSRAIEPAYSSWKAMRYRCLNPSSPKYRYYGGRGIRICARWESFDNFLDDMGPRPEGTTLDRFPNGDGDYEPANCRWATKAQQVANTRRRGPSVTPRDPPSLLSRRFGRLLVVGYAGIQNRKAYWHVLCDCGTGKRVGAANLLKGRTKSCGCFRRQVTANNLPVHA